MSKVSLCVLLGVRGATAVERIWHLEDSQGQILAVNSKSKSMKSLKLFTFRSEAALPERSQPNLTESVHNVVLQKSIPAPIRQPILYISDSKG